MRVANTLGKGIMAGLAGTAAMTAAQSLIMRLTGDEPSDAPVQGGTVAYQFLSRRDRTAEG